MELNVWSRRLLPVSALAVMISWAGVCLAQDTLPIKGAKRTDDLDGMIQRRVIRVLAPHNRMLYFYDGAQARGATYDAMMEFEQFLNRKYRFRRRPIRIMMIPTSRDQLISKLQNGYGDIAAGNLTITPDRQKLVDFSNPVARNITEIVVTGPGGPKLETVEDLADETVHVRASSSYYQSLLDLNHRFKQQGRPPVKLVSVPEYLEDEDLLEMVAAGMVPTMVLDSSKGEFWSQVFPEARFHNEITLRTGGTVGWAFRKNSPQLEQVVNEFVSQHKQGTLLGNMLINRYFKENKWIRNSLAGEERRKLEAEIHLLKKYSKMYNLDWLMVAALAYQESGIDQDKRSAQGAVGIMQILPSTAADKNVAVPEIENKENNIHAGVKYLRFLMDRYFNDGQMDDVNRTLMTFASYNAGPAKVALLRREATKSGLESDIWFNNVEIIASKKIGRETVQYVSNIYKYYVGYRLVLDQLELKANQK